MANPTVTIEIREVGSAKVIQRMRAVRKEAGKLAGAKKRLAKGTKKAGDEAKHLGTGMRNLGSAAIFAVGPLSGVGARLVAFQAIASRTNVTIAAFAAGMAAALVVIVKVIGASIRAALAFQKIISALTVATGSLFGAKDAFEFVTEVSLKLGLSLKEAAEQFGQLSAAARGTTLEGEGIRKVFLGTAKAATALGLNTEQVTGIFRALQQMISKGTVQAEELRGQLGERLPGAFQIAAIAMGKTTAELGKMLKLGKVMAEDLLPKLGAEFEKRFSKQAAIASGNLQSALNRVSTASFLFSLSLDKTIKSSQAAAGFLDTLSKTLISLTENMSSLLAVVGSVAIGFGLMAAPATVRGIIKLVFWIKRLAGVVFGLGLAIATTPVGFFITLGRIAVAAAGGAIAFFAFKDSLKEAAVSQAELIFQLREYIAVVKEAEGATRAAIDVQIRFAEKGIKASIAALTAAKLVAAETLREVAKGTRRQVRGGAMLRPAGAVAEAVVARKEVERLDAELLTLRDLLKSLQGLLVVSIAEAASEELDKIRLQVEALERLNEARRNGESARLAMVQQLELEAGLRKLNITALSAEGKELAKLIARKHEAIRVTKELAEADEASLRAVKRGIAARKKVEKLQEKAEAQITSMEGANAVLRLRIRGLDEEARLMEIRNALEGKYSSMFLQKTVEQLIKLQQEQDALNERLEITNRIRDTLEGGFEQLGNSLVDAFRKGESIIDAFIDTINDLLADLLKLIIRLTIIKPLMESLETSLSGGGGGGFGGLVTSALSLFGFGGGAGAGAGAGAATTAFATPNLGVFQTGGAFNVGGPLGTDKSLVQFKATRGERVTVDEDGSGSGKTFIAHFHFPPGTNVREFAESQKQIAAMAANTLATASASNN